MLDLVQNLHKTGTKGDCMKGHIQLSLLRILIVCINMGFT